MSGKRKKSIDDFTRQELLARAARKKLKYRSRMNKQQLFEALGLAEKPKVKAKTKAKNKTKVKTKTKTKTKAKPEAGIKTKPKPKPKTKTMVKIKTKAGAKTATVRKFAGKTSTSKVAPKKSRVKPEPVSGQLEGKLPPGSVVPPPPLENTSTYLDRGPELPTDYGQDRIVVLTRDPRCLFVYWELCGDSRSRLLQGGAEFKGSIWVLRLTRTRDGRFFDVPVNPDVRNWYLQVDPGESYSVSIGLVLVSGSYRQAAGADNSTPADAPSSVVDQEWMIITREFDRVIRQIFHYRTSGGIGSSDILAGLESVPQHMRLFSGVLQKPKPKSGSTETETDTGIEKS
jgi:hypothetical protein